MTISLTVILIESTNDISYGLPIMITLMVAKWSGDLFNKGLYDIHIDLKSVPLLEWSAPQETYSLRAKHIMESCLSYIYPHTRVQSLVGILRTTAHNAFPVVTVDKYQGNMLSEEDYEGNPVTCNEIYARSRGMTNVISEQKSKSKKNKFTAFDSNRLTSGSPTRNLMLSSSAVNMQSQRANQNAPNIYSSSMPASMMHDGFQQTDFENENNTSEDNVTETSPSQNLPLQEDEDVDIPQSLTFHGVILRSQLVTLVQKQAYYREEEESYCQQILSFPEMTCFYPRYPDIHDLDLREISYESIMDVTPYMNPCPYMVSPDTPVPQVFNLFRTMGLRHLVVVNSKGQITGMITRHNLTHEYLHHVLKLQESGDLIN